jgi:GT2 family glycosyltransferase
VDADTRPPEGWLETVVREFHADQTLVALSGPFIYYDLPARVRALVDIFYRVGWLLHIVNHRLFRRGAMLQGGNFVVRRKALERIGGYDTRFEFYGEDTDIARRIQKVGRVRFTWDLPMSASGRRLRKEGVLTMGRRYAVNHVWTLVFKKPYTRRVKEL